MKIKLKNKVSMAIVIYVILTFRFWYIIKLPIDNKSWTYLLWAIAVVLYIYFLKGKQKIEGHYPFIRIYFTYILFAELIICGYSILKYDETVADMYICAGSYFVLLITYMVLMIFEKKGMEYLLDSIFLVFMIFVILVIIHSLIANHSAINLFYFEDKGSKTDNVRISLGPLAGLSIIYMMYNFLIGRQKKKMMISMLISFFALFYSETTRANEVAICASVFIMWIFYKKNSDKRVIKYIIACFLMIIFFNSQLFSNVLNTFSVDASVNSSYMSTLARYNAIEYFSSYVKSNPIMGMGWIRPKTIELTQIWSGPRGVYFFDDLGFLGQFFRQGILGALIYLVLIFRMVYVYVHIKSKDLHRQKIILMGIITYSIATMVSLNMFDGVRVLAVPFYIAITEYIFFLQKNSRNCLEKQKIKNLIRRE